MFLGAGTGYCSEKEEWGYVGGQTAEEYVVSEA